MQPTGVRTAAAISSLIGYATHHHIDQTIAAIIMSRISFLVAFLLASSCCAFAPLKAATSRTSSTLQLLPHEGSELVAASQNVYTSSKDERINDDAILQHAPVPIAKARTFVARVFSLPATLLHPHEEENVVLYPIVGFRYVKGQSKALPTTSNPSCRLLPRDQVEYGWFRAQKPETEQ